MNNTKRLLMLMICAAILLCFSCASNESGNDNAETTTTESDNNTGDDENTGMEEETAEVADNVPEYNFNGADFIVASVDNPNFSNIYVVAEETGEILNDSIYKRTAYIEERFNVKMSEVFVGDGDVPGRFKREVQSGSQSFHIFNMRCDHALPLWIDGSLVPWDTIPNIDLTKEYWDQSINNFLTVNHYQPMAIGSFNIGTYDLAYALLFNKQLVSDLGLENPYQLVDSGEWTFDKPESVKFVFENACFA